MKNALILHGAGNTSQGNWFPWLKKELEKKGFEVWSPDLPNPDDLDMQRYLDFIFANKNFKFNNETYLIGHSSGAVVIQGLLQNIPDDIMVDTAILVSTFDNYPDTPASEREYRKKLFLKPFDWEKIKKHAKRFIVIHSDNDPYIPAKGAEEIARKLGGQFVLKPDQGHFNLELSEKYRHFPFLLELIK